MTDDALKEWIERVYDPVTGPAPVRDAVLRILIEKADLSSRLHAVEQELEWLQRQTREVVLAIDSAEFRNSISNDGTLAERVDRIAASIESLGPPVLACPRCQTLEPEWEPEGGCWSCVNCMVHFDMPTYYRQVTGQP